MNKFICGHPNCGRSFPSLRGLNLHEDRDARHNPDKNFHRFSGAGNLRHKIPYERSLDSENNSHKKIVSGPQYADTNILRSMINPKNSIGSEIDENYYGFANDDGDEDDDEDEIKIGISEIIHNINLQENLNFEDIQHPCHPDVIQKYILVYRHYQTNLYNQIYGINALESNDIEQFKNSLTDFEIKRLNIFKCYLFAKSCNLSRSNGDELLQLIQYFSPSPELCLPKSWKSVTRAINEQTKFYTCHMETISFPIHWEMEKWDSKNGICPEEVVIRVRDPLELIADQCVNPIIHFLWKAHVNINCYSKLNEKNENVFCDIMTSEWAHQSLLAIREIDPNGLLLPLLFYADGVSIGMNGKANVTPVMMTLGWYSKELFKQDISKMVIGYIDKFSDISDQVLIKHLQETKGFSKTKCEENIKYFKKQIFFKFWEVVLESINAAASRGVLVKILGYNEPKILYPRIAFHAGDDPAQHEVAGIKCGSSVKHNCIHCLYNSTECGQYNPIVHTLRDLSVVQQIKDGEKSFQKYLNGERYTAEELQSLKNLQGKGYHPIFNPFFNAPFGENNHIYNSPTDVMHLFACGLIKSVLQWTLIIICEIRSHLVQKEFPYATNTGLFDKRLMEFIYVPNFPHIKWCKFKDGLIYIAQSKSILEKSYATGSGGGFRSSEYIPALIQTFFVIGEMGDIIPNQKSFRFNKKLIGPKDKRVPVELGNVTQKVHHAILAVLDMYFACKCNEYTQDQIQLLERMGVRMEAHIKVLWNLKQAIMYEIPREILMRKLHAPCHIPQHIKQFGPIIYADTDVYESSHKFFTTGVWRGTSKRHETLVKEMTTASVIQSHAGHLNFYTTLKLTNGINKCEEKFGPKNGSDGFIINPFTNIADIRFVITAEKYAGNNILKGCGPNSESFTEKIFGHSSLPTMKSLSQYLRGKFSNKVWNEMTKVNTMFEFSIVRAASYEGSEESGVGKGVLYAMSKNNGKFKRYDFVTVKVLYEEDGVEKEVDQVAQILSIIQLHLYELNNKNERVEKRCVWYLIVQYMKECPRQTISNKPNTSQHEQIKHLQWERNRVGGKFTINMINMDCLVGSAMVIPYFSNIVSNRKIGPPTIGNPIISDTFWYLDRKFFDRSGWEELVVVDTNTDENHTIRSINSNNIEAFINENYIQPTQNLDLIGTHEEKKAPDLDGDLDDEFFRNVDEEY